MHIELEPRVFQPQHDTQIDWCLAHQLTTHQPLSNISSHSHFVVTISISKQRGSEGGECEWGSRTFLYLPGFHAQLASHNLSDALDSLRSLSDYAAVRCCKALDAVDS